jgi:hypothetical protein
MVRLPADVKSPDAPEPLTGNGLWAIFNTAFEYLPKE